ncbi:MAG: GH36-type glycosyl hydrolase domain-containing protein [Phycisphaerales bacterium]
MLDNTFGHFDPSGRAFHITNRATPVPWCNVICNGRYGLVLSQNGGGFSWYDDAQHNVLTRWEMDLVRDCYGKFLYLADLDSGQIWSAAPAPTQVEYQHYLCTHALGSSTFTTRYADIEAKWTLGVAPAEPCELWWVELTNTSTRPRRLRISSYFEWTCGVAPDTKREFHRLFFTTRHDAQRRAIVATKNMWDIRPKSERDHWNQPWPYAAAHALGGDALTAPIAIADKAAFLGRYGSTASPAAMKGAAPGSTGFGRFGDACAALGGEATLAPGQTIRLHYLLAIGKNEREVLGTLDKFLPPAAAQATILAGESAWQHRLSPTTVKTQRDDFDVLNNHWLPYQAISGRLWGRTGYYQQSGAFGFRDQLQDSQVWLPLEPSRCLDQIMLHAERQFVDGSVYHWWHALADFGNHTACSDDYLWLPHIVAAYIRETGDLACLKKRALFVDDPAGGTLLDHCQRAFARSFSRHSSRGLPLIGSCDWNDGLSAMGIDGKGESVWLGWFLAATLGEWVNLYTALGDTAAAEGCRVRAAALFDTINALAWDGQHYRYGTKDNGEWVGASSSPEGKVHLNAQTWAILGEGAPADRADAAWATVKRDLLSPYGPLLLAPAYTTPDPTIGYITRYCPGSRENGGVYMHAATWALAAACKRRDQASVAQIWNAISPPERAKGDRAAKYWAEPYSTPGNVDGPLSDLPGRAGWTWYTGSAAWLNRIALEWMLGIRPTWGGLLIDPVPTADLGRVSAARTWRGRSVRVSFDAGEFVADRAAAITVNGRSMETNVISPEVLAGVPVGGTLDVVVRWPTVAGGGDGAGGGAANAAGGARALAEAGRNGNSGVATRSRA